MRLWRRAAAGVWAGCDWVIYGRLLLAQLETRRHIGLPLSLESVFISRRVPLMLGIRMRFGVSPMKQDVSENLGSQDVIGIWCVCVAIHL